MGRDNHREVLVRAADNLQARVKKLKREVTLIGILS